MLIDDTSIRSSGAGRVWFTKVEGQNHLLKQPLCRTQGSEDFNIIVLEAISIIIFSIYTVVGT